MNTDPNAWPAPKQLFSRFWPFVASTLGMLFESVACKFTRTDDMRWLCVDAMNDDIKATVALGLLVAPAERAPPSCARVRPRHDAAARIVQVYKTLPRDQHDDVLVNACIVLANVAKLSEPELRAQTLPVDDFVDDPRRQGPHVHDVRARGPRAHVARRPGFRPASSVNPRRRTRGGAAQERRARARGAVHGRPAAAAEAGERRGDPQPGGGAPPLLPPRAAAGPPSPRRASSSAASRRSTRG